MVDDILELGIENVVGVSCTDDERGQQNESVEEEKRAMQMAEICARLIMRLFRRGDPRQGT